MLIISQYFSKEEILSLFMWNCAYQFGDFIVLILAKVVLEKVLRNSGYSFVITNIILFVLFFVNLKFFTQKSKNQDNSELE